jgi:hypothetical protein
MGALLQPPQLWQRGRKLEPSPANWPSKLKGRSVVSLRPFSFALFNLIDLPGSGQGNLWSDYNSLSQYLFNL